MRSRNDIKHDRKITFPAFEYRFSPWLFWRGERFGEGLDRSTPKWSDYTLITNLMHWLLFIHKILFSSTCFEHQVLIFRRTSLYTCSIWYRHSLWENYQDRRQTNTPMLKGQCWKIITESEDFLYRLKNHEGTNFNSASGFSLSKFHALFHALV